MSTHAQFVEASGNTKLGRIPCVTVEQSTCWRGCALWEKCYAFGGRVRMNWDKVTSHTWGSAWAEVVRKIAALPRWQPWRYAVAGDLPGANARINAREFKQLVKANGGKPGWTYTHKPLTPTNVALLRFALRRGFTINVSANSPAHADEIANQFPDLPIATLMPEGPGRHALTPEGRSITQCPAQFIEEMTCAHCLLCAMPGRTHMVGFKPEGGHASKRFVTHLLERTNQ
jgi:hypothetical protein